MKKILFLIAFSFSVLFGFAKTPYVSNIGTITETYVKGDTITTIAYNKDEVIFTQPINDITVKITTKSKKHSDCTIAKYDEGKKIKFRLTEPTSNSKVVVKFNKKTHDITISQ